MQYVAGHILTEDGFIEGHIGFEGGTIKEVGEGRIESPLAEGIIIPTFINAHTHLADYVVPVDLSLSLESIMAPPTGLKHRALAATPRAVQAAGMKYLSRFMLRRGISQFIDFREGGIEGAKILNSTKGEGAHPFIMGRPRSLRFDEEEAIKLLDFADGISVSGIAEWDYDELLVLADLVRERKKMFALHASEWRREDIDRILRLKPSFLVHMAAATDDDIRTCAEERVPIVVCPRSNFFFGITPPLAKMLDQGVQVALGTDNAMITMPDILSEIDFAGRLLRQQGVRELDCVLRMAIHNGRKILNHTRTIAMKPGLRCDFMVIGSKNGNPVTDLVLRSGTDDPLLVCTGNGIWKGRQWPISARS